jgi:hypothetical protein
MQSAGPSSFYASDEAALKPVSGHLENHNATNGHGCCHFSGEVQQICNTSEA